MVGVLGKDKTFFQNTIEIVTGVGRILLCTLSPVCVKRRIMSTSLTC